MIFTKVQVVVLLMFLFFGLPANSLAKSEQNTVELIKKRGYILWGTDLEGGAPYVFHDPLDTSRILGFEYDIALEIAKHLGVELKIVQNAWDSLIPALERKDFDFAMNGIEITEDRKKKILFSIPYYVYSEQLVVRKDDDRIKSINDLKGMKVGTLQGAVAQRILESIGGINIKFYSGVVEPYEDLVLKRLDAVFLDYPIAAYYAKPNPRLKFVGEREGIGFYGIAMRKDDKELKQEIDRVLRHLIVSGKLKEIYEKWSLWNEDQEKLKKEHTSFAEITTVGKDVPIYNFIPDLLKGAGITVLLSTVSMAFAIFLGLILVMLKEYATTPLRQFANIYIEIYRGTPLLIQLYILYYGLPNLGFSMEPLTAAIVGLGMNYAAYEAELYRAGINAIPKGQMEAALSLGMTKFLAVRRIILPQAFKIALPGITNDFIALFKDSSLVSVIAMIELTKTYTMLSASTLRYFELGLITAVLYFGMSYPLSLLAKRLEERLKRKKR